MPLIQPFNFLEILNKLMLISKLPLMNLIEPKKKSSVNKLPIWPSLLTKTRPPEMKLLPIENTLNKKLPLLTNTLFGSITEETKFTKEKNNSKKKDVMHL